MKFTTKTIGQQQEIHLAGCSHENRNAIRVSAIEAKSVEEAIKIDSQCSDEDLKGWVEAYKVGPCVKK